MKKLLLFDGPFLKPKREFDKDKFIQEFNSSNLGMTIDDVSMYNGYADIDLKGNVRYSSDLAEEAKKIPELRFDHDDFKNIIEKYFDFEPSQPFCIEIDVSDDVTACEPTGYNEEEGYSDACILLENGKFKHIDVCESSIFIDNMEYKTTEYVYKQNQLSKINNNGDDFNF